MMYTEHLVKWAEPPSTSISSSPLPWQVSHLKAMGDGAKVT